MDDATEVPADDMATRHGERDGKTHEFAGAGPSEPDPPNPGVISTGPVVRSDLGPDFGSDAGNMPGAGGMDVTAPVANPVQPGPDDDLDRDSDSGVQNTRANF